MRWLVVIWRCGVCRRLYMNNSSSIVIDGVCNCSKCYSRFTKEELKEIVKEF